MNPKRANAIRFTHSSIKADVEQRIDEAKAKVSALSVLINRECGKVSAYYTINQAWHRLDDALRELNGK